MELMPAGEGDYVVISTEIKPPAAAGPLLDVGVRSQRLDAYRADILLLLIRYYRWPLLIGRT